MKIVYLVEKRAGTYDDRITWVDRVYLDQVEAYKYAENYNKRLALLKNKMNGLYASKSEEGNYDDLFWDRYNCIVDQGDAYIKESKLYDIFR